MSRGREEGTGEQGQMERQKEARHHEQEPLRHHQKAGGEQVQQTECCAPWQHAAAAGAEETDQTAGRDQGGAKDLREQCAFLVIHVQQTCSTSQRIC